MLKINNGLKIFSNKENTKWTIATEDSDFYSSNFDDIASCVGVNELRLLETMEKYEANIKFYNYRKDIYCTKNDYIDHFENYNSDEDYILPICIFNNYEDTEIVLNTINAISKIN